MGMYPCDLGGHRYVGPQQTIYPAIVGGGFATRRKLRLCAPHFESLLDSLETRACDASLDAPELQVARCINCGQDADSEALQFFATVYGRGAERRDFWAPLHGSCDAASREDWALGAQAT